MLIAVITAYLMMHYGSGSSALMWQYDQTEKLIKQNVAGEARQKQALEIVNQMKAATETHAKEREKSVGALVKVLSVRETPVAAIGRAGQPLIAEDRATAEKLLDLRFKLKSVLRANEWAKVLPVRSTTDAAGGKNP
jgi:hypothetical protein